MREIAFLAMKKIMEKFSLLPQVNWNKIRKHFNMKIVYYDTNLHCGITNRLKAKISY